ncbi:33575_t:CDS:1, partial [Gigaspora margarita]
IDIYFYPIIGIINGILTVSPVKCKFCEPFNSHLSMDFYSTSSVEDWTSGRIIEHYQAKLKGNRAKILD